MIASLSLASNGKAYAGDYARIGGFENENA